MGGGADSQTRVWDDSFLFTLYPHQPQARQRSVSALGSWQQDKAEGARAQAVVELPYLPAPAPGSYLRVVHIQNLGSKPRTTVSQGTLRSPP